MGLPQLEAAGAYHRKTGVGNSFERVVCETYEICNNLKTAKEWTGFTGTKERNLADLSRYLLLIL
jgi:hypothetical protein